MFNKYHFSANSRPDAPFRRGLFKYVVLQYLQDKPCHGYEIIQALSRRFHGFYTPSPGTVYPRLGKLETEGLISGTEREGRKVYSITGEGRSFLAGNADMEKELNERMSDWENPENIVDIKKTMRELGIIGEILGWEIRKMSPVKLKQVQDVLSQAHSDIDAILKE